MGGPGIRLPLRRTIDAAWEACTRVGLVCRAPALGRDCYGSSRPSDGFPGGGLLSSTLKKMARGRGEVLLNWLKCCGQRARHSPLGCLSSRFPKKTDTDKTGQIKNLLQGPMSCLLGHVLD